MTHAIQVSNPIDKNEKILTLLYRFRFLSGRQIQKLLNHKYHSRINSWLNQLTQQQHINQRRRQTFPRVSSVYSLGVKGRKYLLKLNNTAIRKELLDRVWRERTLTTQTRKHLMLVADLYIALRALAAKNQAELSFYTKTELSMYEHLIRPTPDAYFVLAETSGLTNRFFVEVIDDFPARGQLIKLVFNYFTYYAKGFWQTHANKPFPYIILITPDARTAGMLFGLIRYKLKTNPDLNFFLLKRQDVPLLGIKTGLLTAVKKRVS
jgi:hypothetical protein